MDQANILDVPTVYPALLTKSKEIGFTMPSDQYIGTLLKTLVASKPSGNFLELGTGMGLSLAWMLKGMDSDSRVVSIDNNKELIDIAADFFSKEERLQLICADGEEWIMQNQEQRFDLIFADAWPGKYSQLEMTLEMLKVGGFYVIDDMMEQPNWPKGHSEHVATLVDDLEKRQNFTITKMDWSTGVIVAVKIK
nr:class I SAM-dependent methyltransferase [Allomuricauda sp.]